MTFAQLHYFLSQNIGGGQKILCPPLFKSWGGHVPPVPSINSVRARGWFQSATCSVPDTCVLV